MNSMNCDVIIAEKIVRPEINSLLAKAKISERPLIVVEGVDDVQFYDRIAKCVKKDVTIRAVETIQNFEEGCEGVVRLVEELQSIFMTNDNLLGFFLGIIDKDVRDLRMSLRSELKGLFVLKYYSYESHFATQNILKDIIRALTYVDSDLLNDQTLSHIYEKLIKYSLESLKIPTIESLVTAIDKDYSSNFSFSSKIENYIFNTPNSRLLNGKENEILKKAKRLGIEVLDDFDFYKRMSKGKWLIRVFYYKLLELLEDLPHLCQTKEISICQICTIGNHDRCLYRKKIAVSRSFFPNYVIQNFLDNDETSYIAERIISLN